MLCSSIFAVEMDWNKNQPLELVKTYKPKRKKRKKKKMSPWLLQQQQQCQNTQSEGGGAFLLKVWIDFKKCMNWLRNICSHERHRGCHQEQDPKTPPRNKQKHQTLDSSMSETSTDVTCYTTHHGQLQDTRRTTQPRLMEITVIMRLHGNQKKNPNPEKRKKRRNWRKKEKMKMQCLYLIVIW